MADLTGVVKTLREEKVDEKTIADFVVSVNNTHAQQIQIELATTLGEKDLAILNSMDEATAHKEISKRYKEITGTSIEQKSNEILDGFVTGFLSEYQKQKLQGKRPG